jgi:hypothetical protein
MEFKFSDGFYHHRTIGEAWSKIAKKKESWVGENSAEIIKYLKGWVLEDPATRTINRIIANSLSHMSFWRRLVVYINLPKKNDNLNVTNWSHYGDFLPRTLDFLKYIG